MYDPMPPPIDQQWPEPPPAPPAVTAVRGRLSRIALAAIAVGAVVILGSGVGAAVVLSRSHPTTAPRGGSSPAATPVAAASGTDTAAWSELMSTDLSTLEGDESAVSQDGADPVQMSTDLTTMLTDIASFQSDMATTPAPPAYRQAEATIALALTDYSTACSESIDAIANNDSSELEAATTLIATANGLIDTADAQLHAEG